MTTLMASTDHTITRRVARNGINTYLSNLTKEAAPARISDTAPAHNFGYGYVLHNVHEVVSCAQTRRVDSATGRRLGSLHRVRQTG